MSSLSKDEEAAALAWLRTIASDIAPMDHGMKMARIIETMLARPVLPVRLTSEDAQAIGYELATKYGVNISPAELEATFLAMRRRFTKPKTKEVEVWRVEWASKSGIPFVDQFHGERAEQAARRRAMEEPGECVRVIGPHKQEVPDG